MLLRLLLLAGLVVLGFRAFTGRWPWEPKGGTRAQAVTRARELLGVSAEASRDDVMTAHKRLVALVHPDRGGSNGQVHEANAARDLLLDELPRPSQPPEI